MKNPVVRVVNYTENIVIDAGFLECLRYAGVIRVHPLREGVQVFDILPPLYNTPDHSKWADMNAERMRSFGYNAVVAPAAENS